MKTLLLRTIEASAIVLLWRRHLAFEKSMREWALRRDQELFDFADALNKDWSRFAKEVNSAFKRAGRR